MASYYAKALIAHPDFNCEDGRPIRNCPPALLRQLLADGLIAKKEGEEELAPEVSLILDQDALSELDVKGLVWVIVNNKLPVRPTKAWTLDEIRQAIRDTVDVETLKMPNAVVAEQTDSQENQSAS